MFTVTLPLIDPKSGQALEPHSDKTPGGLNSFRLAIVDDNEDAALSLAALLEAVGHQVLVYPDAGSALAAPQCESVHAFVLDIGLPDVDGYELARRLRANPATAGAMLIALTGYGQEQDRVLSRAVGFDHHFVKPVDVLELTNVLAELGDRADLN